MEGLTAKVFRTYNASITLQKELESEIKNFPMEERLKKYDEANKQVAILCNHQKTATKAQDQSIETADLKLNLLKEHLEESKKHFQLLKKNKPGLKDYEKTLPNCKPYNLTFPSTFVKCEQQIKKLEDKIIREEQALAKRKDLKSIALGTSKLNYNDPRITVAWCKKNEVPIEKRKILMGNVF